MPSEEALPALKSELQRRAHEGLPAEFSKQLPLCMLRFEAARSCWPVGSASGQMWMCVAEHDCDAKAT